MQGTTFVIDQAVVESIRARCADVEIEDDYDLATCRCCGYTITTRKGSPFHNSAKVHSTGVYTGLGICADCSPIMDSTRHPKFCATNRELLIEKSIEALHSPQGAEIEVSLEAPTYAPPRAPSEKRPMTP